MRKQQKSILVLATIAVFVTTAAFLPGLVRAGNLEPSTPPGSTMKTLDEVPPTWSQILPAPERFELVFPIEVLDFETGLRITVYTAVLDKETGLVWERSPDTTKMSWYEACTYCYRREVGSRKGWRLPAVEELTSLIDTTNTNPALPTGHPFSNVQPSYYWSSTTYASSTNAAWRMDINGGVYIYDKGFDLYAWCVRGGYGYDGY